MLDKTCMIAVCGKGGVGKTSISAMMVRQLLQNPQNKVLAIDADPAVGLATALGISAGKTVDDVRNDLICRVAGSHTMDKAEMLALLDYDMLSALAEKDNLAFLAIGRPEKEGCYCRVNHILKDIIKSLAVNFDYVVIDGEAGIEQVNRRVMESVTHLVLVSDTSVKGLGVVKAIKDVSDTAIACDHAGLILNRLRGAAEFAEIRPPSALPLMGWIPEDDAIRLADAKGESILEIADNPATIALRGCLNTIM